MSDTHENDSLPGQQREDSAGTLSKDDGGRHPQEPKPAAAPPENAASTKTTPDDGAPRDGASRAGASSGTTSQNARPAGVGSSNEAGGTASRAGTSAGAPSRTAPFAEAGRDQTSPYEKAMLTPSPSARTQGAPGAQGAPTSGTSTGGDPSEGPAPAGKKKKKPTPANKKAGKRSKRPTFGLSPSQAEAYEEELRGRIGLLPRGVVLPLKIRIQGWVVTLMAAILAFGTRFWNLTHPRAVVFDETYYVKGAFSLLRMGYEGNWQGDDANDLFLRGDYSALKTEADRVVHPPFGKWVMAVGQGLFGTDNGVGWRFSTAILGVLSVILLVRIAMRLFRSPWLAGFAGLAMALDGMGIVLSRTGILDNILAFFTLLGFYFVLLDRERHGGRLASRVAHGLFRDTPEARAAVAAGDLRGSQLVTADPWAAPSFARPWLVAAGISLGLACGVKWSGIYAIAAFGLLVLVFGVASRKVMGAPLYFGGAAFRDGVPAFIALVPTALVAYLAQWYPWFRNPNSLDRNWAAEAAARGESMPISWAPDVVNSFLHYHMDMWTFHHNLSSKHTYQSQAWEWLVQGRPVNFYWKDDKSLTCSGGSGGSGGGSESGCVEAITSIGNIAVWWLALVGLLVVIYGALARSDWRAWAILAGYAGLWAPWLLYTNRTIFQFYAVVLLPFVVLALTYAVAVAARMLGDSRSYRAAGRRRGLMARHLSAVGAGGSGAKAGTGSEVGAAGGDLDAGAPGAEAANAGATAAGAAGAVPAAGATGAGSYAVSGDDAAKLGDRQFRYLSDYFDTSAKLGEAGSQLGDSSLGSGNEPLPGAGKADAHGQGLLNANASAQGGSSQEAGPVAGDNAHEASLLGAGASDDSARQAETAGLPGGEAASLPPGAEPEEFSRIIDPTGDEPARHWWLPPKPRVSSYVVIGAVGAVIIAAAVFWYPIWTGMTVPRSFWQMHMWFRSWI